MDSLNFDGLEELSLPVTIKGKKYTLREATGDAVCRYNNAEAACYTYGEKGEITSVKGLADCGPFLVSLCMFDEKGHSVPLELIRSWPNRVQNELIKQVKHLSELDMEETVDSINKRIEKLQERLARRKKYEETLKNGQSTTTDG